MQKMHCRAFWMKFTNLITQFYCCLLTFSTLTVYSMKPINVTITLSSFTRFIQHKGHIFPLELFLEIVGWILKVSKEISLSRHNKYFSAMENGIIHKKGNLSKRNEKRTLVKLCIQLHKKRLRKRCGARHRDIECIASFCFKEFYMISSSRTCFYLLTLVLCIFCPFVKWNGCRKKRKLVNAQWTFPALCVVHLFNASTQL